MLRILTLLSLSATLALAQNATKQGLEPGSVIPGSFDPFNLNGKWKNRFHCLVCENGLNPVVMIFTREPADGKDEALNELLQKLDETIEKNPNSLLGGFVVFVSPDARSSANQTGVADATKLVEEAVAREALEKRLATRAEKLKHVIVSHHPTPGPKNYTLDDKAETTVVFYARNIVRTNEVFAEGKLASADVAQIMEKVENTLAEAKKKKK